MKAITQDRYGSADVLALEDVAVPVLGDEEVLDADSVGPLSWLVRPDR
jgi:hypothetical protein